MNKSIDTARALYLELRALRLKVWVEDDPDGGFLDYRVALDGLRNLSEIQANRMVRRVRNQQEGLVVVLLDRRGPDLDAVRKEGYCG